MAEKGKKSGPRSFQTIPCQIQDKKGLQMFDFSHNITKWKKCRSFSKYSNRGCWAMFLVTTPTIPCLPVPVPVPQQQPPAGPGKFTSNAWSQNPELWPFLSARILPNSVCTADQALLLHKFCPHIGSGIWLHLIGSIQNFPLCRYPRHLQRLHVNYNLEYLTILVSLAVYPPCHPLYPFASSRSIQQLPY